MFILHPVASTFHLFGFEVHYYSLCIFLAIAVCFVLALQFSDYFNKTKSDVICNFAPLMVIFSIIGARLYYVLLSLDYYLQRPELIFMVWKGGIAIHGAIIAAIIFGVIYFKSLKLNFYDYADIFALVMPLGQAIGRWGNYFNQEVFGKPVHNSIIALFVDDKFRPKWYSFQGLYHPAFLYESILDLIIFVILFFIMKKTASIKSGFTFFSYIILYSVVRAIIEPIRLDTVYYIMGIPFPLIVSLIGIIIGVIGIFYIKAKV